ncbi:Protein kinase-like domain protein, partial [Metarhizium majus ARSEF 297]
MTDQLRSDIIKNNPIKDNLDDFRTLFASTCQERGLECSPDALASLDRDDLQNVTIDLILALQRLRISRLLLSAAGSKTVLSDLFELGSAAASADFDFDRVRPLLKSALASKLDDADIWDQVYHAVTEAKSTPPPQPIASSLQQTPWQRNTSSFANSSEYRRDVDMVLKEELGPLYVGVPGFCEKFLGNVPDLASASEAVFKKCIMGDSPLFRSGWTKWPSDANQDGVLSWFADLTETLARFAEPRTIPRRRRPLAQPNKPIQGSTGERKLDVGFVDDPEAGKESKCHWSHILIPGELKSNPTADIALKAWLDLGRYTREVLTAQDTRRFVLGFTLCGSLIRLWRFDRIGGVASEQFDVNTDGLQFVKIILAFLWMNEEDLGFDPTVIVSSGKKFVDIERNGHLERLIIDKTLLRVSCIAGRATTCWKAHREGSSEILVIKDSWQYKERKEEGDLLQLATMRGVSHIARYYHHEVVKIRGIDDDVRHNVRKGLDVTKAANYRPGRSGFASLSDVTEVKRRGHSDGTGLKRSSSQTFPPSKRARSESPIKASVDVLPDRIHRRGVISDYGKPIYTASTPVVLLNALADCIEGHKSLRKMAGLLHRDISMNNLMIDEDSTNPSRRSFLIDLDLATEESRAEASGSRGKTGTRAFMAIGALLGEQHLFMHDLESFFWVLFWVCIHYDGPHKEKRVARFDKWNFVDTEELAGTKLGIIAEEDMFCKTTSDWFTEHYKGMAPCINKLRKVVFPAGGRWKVETEGLYESMRKILLEARNEVSAK